MTPEEFEAFAKALWYMFAYGSEANRWDDRAKGTWFVKARRVEELRQKYLAEFVGEGK